jgi:uncharacterized membrane protein YgdD (TMEM256/DUF423 family)
MNSKAALRIAAVLGFLAVALGAFGAHSLKATLAANGQLQTWQTAAHYHLVHAVVLLTLALRGSVSRWSFGFFTAGIVIFSGSLYALAVTNIRWLGAITPIGGACLLVGWGLLVCCPRAGGEGSNQ